MTWREAKKFFLSERGWSIDDWREFVKWLLRTGKRPTYEYQWWSAASAWRYSA